MAEVQLLAIESASTVSGFYAAACSLPFDYAKTQIQKMQPDAQGKYPYTGSLYCTMKTGGPFKSYTGFPVYCLLYDMNFPQPGSEDREISWVVEFCAGLEIFVRVKNFGVWIDKVVPTMDASYWAKLDSGFRFTSAHLEERTIADVGPTQWQKACFVPTKSDAVVVGFRKWLNKYAVSQVDWRGKLSGALPPTPPREQLMDRYWTHVVSCSSCKAAFRGLIVLELCCKSSLLL
ncbi:hypothetical protein TIFTF001_028146 [Ficus carica]|uniref:Uncharacterized protein n=1 Tax=Ficus carica TaxID=3494 RepID=A0AA88DPD9_FICCA|nr:hypothetical protein TIFTF001_028146 [Ficus carica]